MFIGFLILFVRLSHLFFLHLIVFPLKKEEEEEIRDRVSEFMFAKIGVQFSVWLKNQRKLKLDFEFYVIFVRFFQHENFTKLNRGLRMLQWNN